MNILLLQTKFEDFDSIGFYLIATEPGRKQKINDVDTFQDEEKVIVRPEFKDPNQCTIPAHLPFPRCFDLLFLPFRYVNLF